MSHFPGSIFGSAFLSLHGWMGIKNEHVWCSESNGRTRDGFGADLLLGPTDIVIRGLGSECPGVCFKEWFCSGKKLQLLTLSVVDPLRPNQQCFIPACRHWKGECLKVRPPPGEDSSLTRSRPEIFTLWVSYHRSHTGSDTACCNIPGRQTSARKATDEGCVKCCYFLVACCTLGPLRPSSDLHSSSILVMPTFQRRKPRLERRSELCKLLQE